MAYAQVKAGSVELLTGETITSTHTYEVNGAPITQPVDIPYGYLALWSAAERAAHGIYEVIDDEIPAGKRATGSSLILDDDVVRRVHTLETIPLAEIAARAQARIVSGAQERLDAFARTRGYDGILSACTYVASSVEKFAAEGACCVAQRDATWSALYGILAEVEAGTRALPTGFADIEGDLPALEWPTT